jgi:hypothetical protein
MNCTFALPPNLRCSGAILYWTRRYIVGIGDYLLTQAGVSCPSASVSHIRWWYPVGGF